MYMNIKFKKPLLTILGFLILTGCSKPATPEEIKHALEICPDTSSDIRFEFKNCFGHNCEPDPITHRKLKSILKDCLKQKEIKEDPESKMNISRKQREAFEEYYNY